MFVDMVIKKIIFKDDDIALIHTQVPIRSFVSCLFQLKKENKESCFRNIDHFPCMLLWNYRSNSAETEPEMI